MKKFTPLALFLGTAFLLSACSDNKEKSLEPTIENLSGTWRASAYTYNKQTVDASEYPDDYVHINPDRKFTARFELLEGYCYGTASANSGKAVLQSNAGTVNWSVNELTKDRLEIKNNEGYTQVFNRIANPTLFRVANKTTITEPSYLLTAAMQGSRILYLSGHGVIGSNQQADQIAYTEYPAGMHVGSLHYVGGRTIFFLSAYPQKVVAGNTQNQIFMADTTQVYDLSEALNSNAGLGRVTKTDLNTTSGTKTHKEFREEYGL